MKHKKLTVVAVLSLWFLMPAQPAAGVYLCTETGVIGQDNFDNSRQGRYCSTYKDDAKSICGTQTTVTQYCSSHCNTCGGTSAGGTCTYVNSTSPGDTYAINAGCTAAQYGEFYRFDCTCNYPPPSCSCNGSQICCETTCGGVWSEDAQSCSTGSPLVIDLKSNTASYHFTSATDGVLFDLDADGKADQVAWTGADSEVAFLALDRNENGYVDDGSELFGTATPKRDGTVAGNGFEALQDLDRADGSDGQIDASDAAYGQLRLWIDRNHDGLSDPTELATLSNAGVTSIRTAYSESNRRDRHGNLYKYNGSAFIVNNGGVEVERRVFDVFLTIKR